MIYLFIRTTLFYNYSFTVIFFASAGVEAVVGISTGTPISTVTGLSDIPIITQKNSRDVSWSTVFIGE